MEKVWIPLYILRNDEMSRWRSFSFDTFLSSLNHHLPKKIKVQKWKSLSFPRGFNVFLMSSVHHHIVRQKKRMLVQTQIKMASLVSILPGRVVSIVLNSWTVSFHFQQLQFTNLQTAGSVIALSIASSVPRTFLLKITSPEPKSYENYEQKSPK